MINPISIKPGESSVSPEIIAKTPTIVIKIGINPIKIILKKFITQNYSLSEYSFN